MFLIQRRVMYWTFKSDIPYFSLSVKADPKKCFVSGPPAWCKVFSLSSGGIFLSKFFSFKLLVYLNCSKTIFQQPSGCITMRCFNSGLTDFAFRI